MKIRLFGMKEVVGFFASSLIGDHRNYARQRAGEARGVSGEARWNRGEARGI